MKIFVLIICLSASMAGLALSDSGVQTAPTAPADQPSPEFARLQQEFAKRRAEALRPAVTWYRAQLEALQRKLRDEPAATQAALAQALAAARETFWQDDQPELRQALLAAPWLWRSDDDAEGVATTFFADGTVRHIGMRGTWRITGPCEVTISTEEKEQFVLRFNASLSAYEANRHNVSGHRIASAQ